jgi:hypothetical protein
MTSDFNCNWLGGQVVAKEINAPGFEDAGFVNITTSDGIVHGQVKQSDLYSFVRIYESGHEVPFYQPLAALELFERALARRDIATGEDDVTCSGSYKTVGTPTSDYREGNSTIVLEVLPSNATYNTALNGPDPVPTWSATPAKRKRDSSESRPKTKRNLGKLGRPIRSKGGKRPAL